MPVPRLSKLELQIMEALWTGGHLVFGTFKRPFQNGLNQRIPRYRPLSKGEQQLSAFGSADWVLVGRQVVNHIWQSTLTKRWLPQILPFQARN